MKKSTIFYSFKSSLPVMAGYIVLGIGFGILLQSKGFGLLYAFLMSLLIYAGSLQYVAVDLMASSASLITAAIISFMVNIRHLFYGITMLEKYKNTGKTKPYLIFALTDETFSLVCTPNLPGDVDEKQYYFFVSLFNQSYWVAGSLIGNALGNILPFSTAGIDFSMTALFLVILLSQWESTRDHRPALIGIITSVVCLLIFGANNFLIPSMLIITLLLFAIKHFDKSDDESKSVNPDKSEIQDNQQYKKEPTLYKEEQP